MRILVTAGTSFIGRALVQKLLESGHEVRSSARKIDSSAATFSWQIGNPMPEEQLAWAEIIIHLAWALGPTEEEANVQGLTKLVKQARQAGVKKQLFVSSLSAHDRALSAYGKGKFRAESIFKYSGDIIIRPGLVIGPGGGFRNLARNIKTVPIIPMIGGGSQSVPLISANDLVRIMEQLCTEQTHQNPTCHDLYYSPPPSLRSLVLTISHSLGVRRFLVPVPAKLVLFAAHAFERMGLKSPVSSEQILGIIGNKKARLSPCSQILKQTYLFPQKEIEITMGVLD